MLSASDVLSSSEVFSNSSSMRTCTSNPSVSYSSSCGTLTPTAYVFVSVFHWTSVHLSLYMHTSLGCVGAFPLGLTMISAPQFVGLAGWSLEIYQTWWLGTPDEASAQLMMFDGNVKLLAVVKIS